jgi:hypothetical protein
MKTNRSSLSRRTRSLPLPVLNSLGAFLSSERGAVATWWNLEKHLAERDENEQTSLSRRTRSLPLPVLNLFRGRNLEKHLAERDENEQTSLSRRTRSLPLPVLTLFRGAELGEAFS